MRFATFLSCAMMLLGAVSVANPLHDAAAAGDVSKVRSLVVEQHVPVDQRDGEDTTALCYAARDGRYAVCEFLVAQHADVDASQRTTHMSWMDLSHGSDAALDYAIENDHLDIADLLLRHGAQVNRPGFWGYEPLHQARSAAAVRLLVSHGARLEDYNMNGAPTRRGPAGGPGRRARLPEALSTATSNPRTLPDHGLQER